MYIVKVIAPNYFEATILGILSIDIWQNGNFALSLQTNDMLKA